MYNSRPEDSIFAVELKNRRQLNALRKYLQNEILLDFVYQERMEESSWPSRCLKFEAGGSLARGQRRKASSEAMRRDLEDRNSRNLFIKIFLADACEKNTI